MELHPDIEAIVKKRRLELAEKIKKNASFKNQCIFIVKTADHMSEIMIPGIHEYTDSEEMKDKLATYIKHKWSEYSKKQKMDLSVVAFFSDAWITEYDCENIEQKDHLISTVPKPSQDPRRRSALMVSVYGKDGHIAKYYPYSKVGKHIVFRTPIGDELDAASRFYNLFPL